MSSGFKYEILNNVIVSGDALLFNSHNRAIRYGDGIFETICVRNDEPLFLQDHWNRLEHGLQVLGIPMPPAFSYKMLDDSIRLLLHKNELSYARMRLMLFREADGMYIPETKGSTWHLSVTGTVPEFYQSNEVGLSAGVFELDHKTCGPLSNLKSLNALIYVMAGRETLKAGIDEMFITNEQGKIIESVSSNIFIRKGKLFITPPLSQGCLDGILRKQILKLLPMHELEIRESPITKDDLLNADEIILTNVIRGAAWVGSFRKKSFEQLYCTKINNWLNEI